MNDENAHPRDWDALIVIPAKTFSELYAPGRLSSQRPAEVVERWAKEEWGEVASTSLWLKYHNAKKLLDKEAYQRWTGLVLDIRVLPVRAARWYKQTVWKMNS